MNLASHIGENEWYLSRYEEEQDKLEEQYINSLVEKREVVIQTASEILQGCIDDDEFYLAFKEWYDEDTGEYDEYLLTVLDDWEADELNIEDYLAMCDFAKSALEAACEIVTGDFLHVIAADGDWNIKVMINELVGGV